MKNAWLFTPLVAASLLLPLAAHAAVLKVGGATITQVNSDTAFGQCYAVLNKAPSSGCTSKTISFDCQGKFYKNGEGNRHYATSLLAFSLNKKVNVWVDSSKKYGSVCVARRISVLK